MTALPPADLTIDNIILVKSRVRRWSTKKDTTEKAWTEWGVKLDLVSVSLLHVAIHPPQAGLPKKTGCIQDLILPPPSFVCLRIPDPSPFTYYLAPLYLQSRQALHYSVSVVTL